MNRQVVIIGAGGHGKVIADIVQKSQDTIVGFLDDNEKHFNQFVGIPILGCIDDYKKYTESEFIIAIGDAKTREMISQRLKGVLWYTAIHPKAIISKLDTALGEGTAVMAGSIINPGIRIGKHCIINSGAIIEHDDVIEDFVHVSVGAKLAGAVHIGKRSWIGIGACVNNNLEICGDCTIGAGAVVVKNIKKPGIYVGIPAKKTKEG